jgi:DNA processing protein
MPDSSEIKFWVGFTKAPGIGKARLTMLMDHFGSLSAAWNAPKSELVRGGLDEKTAENVAGFRDSFSLDNELKLIDKYKIEILTYDSPQYPALLREIYDCPAILYVRGELKEVDGASVAVVGTRRSTAYGRQITEELVSELSASNITIVSGLAKGIDTIAHRSAIDANGRTIAVFASGLDIVYPPENLKLARDIIEHGALVSEYALGTKPKAEHFPRRNRILSGLSKGVVVIESGESGGALITAAFALEQNREVFAVPGSLLSSMSKGPNKLIQRGEAKLVRNCHDIIEELNLAENVQQLEMRSLEVADSTESQILKCIAEGPAHIDEICRGTGLDTSTVVSKLAIMELNGLVRHLGGMSYVLSKNMR